MVARLVEHAKLGPNAMGCDVRVKALDQGDHPAADGQVCRHAMEAQLDLGLDLDIYTYIYIYIYDSDCYYYFVVGMGLQCPRAFFDPP